ncbi:MAG: DUF3007 family protein [Aphanocapsa lilacina HA4352-LM1]|nr:DUF3007 family protein [Aphanocapsa lilacina HA4352-LM1]
MSILLIAPVAYNFLQALGMPALNAGFWTSGVVFAALLGWVYTYTLGTREPLGQTAHPTLDQDIRKLYDALQEEDRKIQEHEARIAQLKLEEEALEAQIQELKRQVSALSPTG